MGPQRVAECFTEGRLRVSVFSRTAIHAPGGWALIENLPHVFTGDRVTVGNSSAYLLPQRQKDRFLLHDRLLVLVTQQCLPNCRRAARLWALGIGVAWRLAA